MTGSRSAWWVAFLLLTLLGVFLRLWNVRSQIMGGDEFHAVRAALTMPLGSILSSYLPTDNCIPMSAIYRCLMDRGVVLSELHFRMVPLICGILLVAVVPLWVARRLDPATGLILGFLLATSPLLVIYSKVGRSYAPIALFATIAILSFDAWLRASARRDRIAFGAAYVLFACLSGWFHLLSTAFVLAPFVYAALALCWHRQERGRRLLRLALLGTATAAGFLAFLVPGWGSLLALARSKVGTDSPGLDTILEVLVLQSGNGLTLLAAAFWILVVIGMGVLLGREKDLGAHLLTLACVYLIALAMLSPPISSQTLVLNRYFLVAAPLLLMTAASGIRAVWATLRATLPGWLAGFAGVAAVLVYCWTSPLLDAGLRRSSFQGHNDLIRFSKTRARPDPSTVPQFYRMLRDAPDDSPILEYPWQHRWQSCLSYPAYQEIHGREVSVVLRDFRYRDPRLAWAHLIHFEEERILATRARYLIIHLDIEKEELALHAPGFVPQKNVAADWAADRAAARRTTARLRGRWGAPAYEDQSVVVWDLDSVREP